VNGQSWSEVAFVVVLALAVVMWFVWLSASRLDRLHRKVSSSRAVLENQLVRRASVAAELAASGLLDPVSSVVVGEAAWRALTAGADANVEDPVDQGIPLGAAADRELSESELSATLRAALGDSDEIESLRATPYGAELLDALAASWYRVQLSRRFHNEAVAQTRRVRRKLVVRVPRLAGRAPLPSSVEIDDAPPEPLTPLH
jgi:hypothetical protein